ncbi:TolC family protein [Gemmata obscuriglobus]|uniref:TolC family protein n=1 Tax=Gemmata obscuriglobus TaxID=114 RepID=UPI00016C521B|nr:TolC family protein [Gemmata obscuriglobus]
MAERSALGRGYDIGRLRLEPAPGSRLADPFDPDRPPKPPDDPAAAILMDHPYKFRGSKRWGKDGYADSIEPIGWETALAPDDKGVVKLDQNKAVEVALLNSREYQSALEDVYLTALGLTLNRFEFDLRWFGRNATTYTHSGNSSLPTESNRLASTTDVGFERNLAAGGQLLVDFANSITYEYTGGAVGGVRSNLLLSLTQPLLRNFGRQVRLEGLTQAERDVLYAVRDFARFRKRFYVSVATQSGGYLDLLLAVQTLRNSEANLKRQEETYRLYNELFRGGRASVVELDQFYQGVQAARQGVIDTRTSLENAKDQFKLTLGLPPRLPIDLDDSPLDQFILTDPALERLREQLEEFQRVRLRELGAPPSLDALRKAFTDLRELSGRGPAAVQSAAADLDAFGRQFDRPARPGDDPEQRDRDKATYTSLKTALTEAGDDLAKFTKKIEQDSAAVTEATRKEGWEAVVQDAKFLLAALDGVISVQTQSRIYRIELPEIDILEEPAMAFAKANRLDLQNRRAQATDAWRKVTVAANALRGGVNVVGTANLVTDADHDKPFNFAGEASSYSVGLQFDAPLNRLAERNVYRASLVSYQRAKRAYVAQSDQVELQIRQDLRELARLRPSFSIARQQVLSAARQYENTRLTLLGPGGRKGANDATSLQLLQALSTLLTQRNALAANFIQFEQRRLQLLLDLEELQLDDRGFPTNAQPRPPARSDDRNGRGTAAPGLPGAPAPRPITAPGPVGP